MAAAFQTWEFPDQAPSAFAVRAGDAIELGSLVAALAEETEDEFELDLRVQAFIETGCVHLLQRVESFDVAPRPRASLVEN